MLTQRLANIIFAVFIFVACVFFGALAQQFEPAGLLAGALPAKFFPQLVLAFTAVCALVVCGVYFARGGAGGDFGKTVFADAGEARRGLLTLLAAVVCYAVWARFGFALMAALMGPLCLLAMGARSWRTFVVVSALFALVYAVFTQLIGVQF